MERAYSLNHCLTVSAAGNITHDQSQALILVQIRRWDLARSKAQDSITKDKIVSES